MLHPPETRYARTGDAHVAYQVFGEGARDIVMLPEWVTHLEALWEHEVFTRLMRRSATQARVILFDKRGVGLSDPVPGTELPSLEAWMDDLQAVMDAAQSERAVLAGMGHGGQMAVMFAATHPERTEALVLTNAYARLSRAPDYPIGIPEKVQDAALEIMDKTWGRPDSPSLDILAPSLASDDDVRRWWARVERLACSPGQAVAMQRAMYSYDVRHVLSSVSQPTLVVHSKGDRLVRVGHGRYLADHIQGAALKELDSDDHWWFAGKHLEEAWTAVAEFAGTSTPGYDPDRVLATLLFTDVVSSTEHAALLGDTRWKHLLEDLDALVARQVVRFSGRLVKSLGDGHLATFDGPGRGIRCATAISEAVRSLGLEVRCGVHTGEIDLRGEDIGGMALHIAARLTALAGPGEVLVSGSVPPLVAGSGFEFGDRGNHDLKGVPGKWRVFVVHP